MIIRNSQFDELGTQRVLGRIVEIICSTHPDARPALTSDEGRKTLREQYRKANHYGLSSDLDVASYVITAWQLGPDFDTRFPAMREILNNSAIPSDRKAESIGRFTVTLLETLVHGK